ncbi:hypothetical protein C3F34_13445 [Acinetobacter sp. ACNIH2]|uniref:DUF3987 domain-containing protein n=1 Tax=Acinetobacter sp. ACNIH2 TaxID=1758189 RepID=UPI000CDC4CC9|nr:DUF3987 domain-containing protein [Acinetobacter sp. ACNIH2]AUX86939.1 hypothetical protein C3F34_13445 [Acinetobacter sp. ACNIH2]
MLQKIENQDLSCNLNPDYTEILNQHCFNLSENDSDRKSNSTIFRFGNPRGGLFFSKEICMNNIDLSGRVVFPLKRKGEITGLNFLSDSADKKDYIVGKGNLIVNSDFDNSIVLVCVDKYSLFKLSHAKYPIIYVSDKNVDKLNKADYQNSQYYLICAKHEENDFKRKLRNSFIKVLALSMPICAVASPREVIAEVEEILAIETDRNAKEISSFRPSNIYENPYPINDFPVSLRNAILCIHEYIKVPIGIAANSVLFAATYIAQRKVDAYDINGGVMPCSLYFLTEGESGDRKSTADKMAMNAVLALEDEKMLEYQKALQAYRNSSQQVSEPVSPKTLFSDTTIEPITSGFINGDFRNIALASDDAAELLSGHTFKSDTAKSSMALLAKMFDKGTIERTRSKGNVNGSGVAFGCRMSIHLMGQPIIIKEVVSDKAMSGIGLLPRFIFTAPKSIAGTRLIDQKELSKNIKEDLRMLTYWEQCKKLLRDDTASDLKESDTERGRLAMTSEAKSLWIRFYNKIEVELKQQGKYSHIKSYGSRAGEIMIRLATVFAFFEERVVVEKADIYSAAMIIMHSLNEWANYDQKHVVHSKSDDILNWLIREYKNGEDKVLKSTLNQYIRSIKSARIRDEALQPLIDTHCVFIEKFENKEYVLLNPKYHLIV